MDVWQLIPAKFRDSLADFYRSAAMYTKHFFWFLFHPKGPDYHTIPIIINNYNRLDCLKKLIGALESRGYENIIILDNQSTYPPLLEYYASCPYEVIHLERNFGFKAIWDSKVYERFKRSFYVYTDPDVVPDENCPEDFMKVFLDALRKYPRCLKAGFGLHIDDLPRTYPQREAVIANEERFWAKPLEDGLFEAQIDTTFALYRPFCYGPANDHHMMIRTGAPYMARHLPWYTDPSYLSDEDRYYIQSARQSTHWTKQTK